MIDQRTVLMLVLTGVIFAVGRNLPLPGIDLQALAEMYSDTSAAGQRMSVFALGIIPLYSALVVGEVVRLSFPRLSRSARTSTLRTFAVPAIALGLTVLQGFGIANALQEIGVVRLTANGFVLTTILSFSGATALLLYLSGLIRLPGLRYGFWALWLIPLLIDLPTDLATNIEMTRNGVMSLSHLIAITAYVGLSVAAMVSAALLWQAAWRESRVEVSAQADESLEILVWPPVLAGLMAGFAIPLLALGGTGLLNAAAHYYQIIAVAVAVVLIPLFACAYVRLASLDGKARPQLIAAGAVVALVQAAILAIGTILETITATPLPLRALAVIGIIAVALSLTTGWRAATIRTP